MRTWILGASDPEMAEIERVLRDGGELVEYASNGGARVFPGNAHKAEVPKAVGDLIAVECGWPGQTPEAKVVDHHSPGHPGYGRPPSEYLEASSLGQVLAILGHIPTQDQLMVAAADHCLGAAYKGECPGIDPEALMAWRAASRAAFHDVITNARNSIWNIVENNVRNNVLSDVLNKVWDNIGKDFENNMGNNIWDLLESPEAIPEGALRSAAGSLLRGLSEIEKGNFSRETYQQQTPRRS